MDQALVEQGTAFRFSRGRGWGVICQAKKRDGTPCRRYSIRGGCVCLVHGGRLPTVKASARARIEALVPAAISVVGNTIENGKPSDQLRAARWVLRYSGITPQNVRAVSRAAKMIEAHVPALEALPDEEIEALLTKILEVDDGQERALESGDGEAA